MKFENFIQRCKRAVTKRKFIFSLSRRASQTSLVIHAVGFVVTKPKKLQKRLLEEILASKIRNKNQVVSLLEKGYKSKLPKWCSAINVRKFVISIASFSVLICSIFSQGRYIHAFILYNRGEFLDCF